MQIARETEFTSKIKIHGEASDADEAAASSWKSNIIPTLLEDYSSCIYGCDETQFHYRAMKLTGDFIMLKSQKSCWAKNPER